MGGSLVDFPVLGREHVKGACLFANRADLILSLSVPTRGVIAEVGVGRGDFSEFLIKKIKPSKFVAFDAFAMDQIPFIWGQASSMYFDGLTHLEYYKRRFEPYGDLVEIENALSSSSLSKYTKAEFDLIYIDAGHDYPSVKSDADLSKHLLNDSGFLVFNDYIMYDHFMNAPYGVVQAVNELIVRDGWRIVGFALEKNMFCDIAISRACKRHSWVAGAQLVETGAPIEAVDNITAGAAKSGRIGVNAGDIIACIEMVLGRTPDRSLVDYHLGLGFPNRFSLGDYMIGTEEFHARYTAASSHAGSPVPTREVSEVVAENVTPEAAKSSPTGVSADDVIACIEMVLGRTPEAELVEYHLKLGFPDRFALGQYMIETGEFQARYSAKINDAGGHVRSSKQELSAIHEFIEIDDGNCPPYSLAVPIEKKAYTQWIAREKHTSDIACLVGDFLGGSGTLIDIGANLGTIAVPAAISGSHVVAVELVPENALYLNLSIIKNRLANVRVFEMAAGENRGLTAFAGSEGTAHVVPAGSGSPAIELPLDDIVELAELAGEGFMRQPMLVKIDTEGYELHVLRGARRIIEEYDPVFVVEATMIEGRNDFMDTRTMRVKSLLEEMRYHLYLHRAGRLIPRTAGDLQEGHVCDYFASRRELKEGERIGRFTVGSIDLEESIDWLREMIAWPEAPHRMHAAGVLARMMSDWRKAPALSALARQLIGDREPAVADFAARMLWVWK